MADELATRLTDTLVRTFGSDIRGVVTRHVIDSTGDPAVWIRIILKDSSLLELEDSTQIESIRTAAEKEARAIGKATEWPYITFRPEAEQREMEESGAKRE